MVKKNENGMSNKNIRKTDFKCSFLLKANWVVCISFQFEFLFEEFNRIVLPKFEIILTFRVTVWAVIETLNEILMTTNQAEYLLI